MALELIKDGALMVDKGEQKWEILMIRVLYPISEVKTEEE
jgi:hypothetical protein